LPRKTSTVSHGDESRRHHHHHHHRKEHNTGNVPFDDAVRELDKMSLGSTSGAGASDYVDQNRSPRDPRTRITHEERERLRDAEAIGHYEEKGRSHRSRRMSADAMAQRQRELEDREDENLQRERERWIANGLDSGHVVYSQEEGQFISRSELKRRKTLKREESWLGDDDWYEQKRSGGY
jgi:hypothetical protein